MIEISRKASTALQDAQLQRNLNHALSHALQARDEAVGEIEEWEQLREHARQVKAHALSRLGFYLEQLEERVRHRGGSVFWARDGQEACRYICDLARRKGIDSAVKSKSMTGEEIGLNHALESAGIEPIESDLGEYIVQLAGQEPSHIIAPALHFSRGEVSQLFAERLEMEPTEDVGRITETARRVLRDKFLSAGMGISGANFAVAETGTLVVVENEGNARLSVSAPSIHVALMGIEKVIPRLTDLSVFLKLLVRSATGQRMTSYVNFISGPRRSGEPDGPAELHLVLLDNGRSRILEDEALGPTLSCIRCGACQNVCPVYQRIGGHAYGSTYQGPIGAILTPQLLSLREAAEHPFASTLCGACADVCPVKIDIPKILLELRRRVRQSQAEAGLQTPWSEAALWLWTKAVRSPRLYQGLAKWGRRLLRPLAGSDANQRRLPLLKDWTQGRALPDLPDKSFREIQAQSERESSQ